MKFMNDWISLALILSLLCAGLVAGKRLGVIASWWLAGGVWLAFRLADSVWKPVVIDLRAGNPNIDLVSTIPLSYGALFLTTLVPTLILLAIVRPKNEFKLPGDTDVPLGVLGGLVASGLLLLGLAQAHIMHPTIKERMPLTIAVVRPMLSMLGQQNIGVTSPTPATTPAKPSG